MGLQGCSAAELEQRSTDDPLILHLAQISHALNLGISAWSRRFGQFAYVGTADRGHHNVRKQAPVFVWSGQNILAKLQTGYADHTSSMTSLDDASTPFGL